MRLWITAFLFALLSSQAFPVAGVWRSMASSIEVAANADADDEEDDDEDGTPGSEESKIKKQPVFSPAEYLHKEELCPALFLLKASQCLMLHGPAHLPLLYAGEVATPPPDFS